MLPGLSRPLVTLSSLGLFAVGAFAMQAVIAQTPAMREDLQVEGVFGSTRLQDLTSMYDHGQYLYRMGYGFLLADAFVLEGSDSPTQLAPENVRAARFERAETLFRESLVLDPANAQTWSSYARALLIRGDTEGARGALERSFALAPTTPGEAYNRLSLISTIRQMTGEADAYAAMAEADKRVLEMHDPDRVPEL